MQGQTQVCYTLEAALESAVEMENRLFDDFQGAIRTVKSQAAKAILKDAAQRKLAQKHQLEKALLDETIDGLELQMSVPTMHLDVQFGKQELHADADAREALAYAIHVVNSAVDYYQQMGQTCAGAPMSKTFTRLSADQTTLLQELEDAYEEHFLPQN